MKDKHPVNLERVMAGCFWYSSQRTGWGGGGRPHHHRGGPRGRLQNGTRVPKVKGSGSSEAGSHPGPAFLSHIRLKIKPLLAANTPVSPEHKLPGSLEKGTALPLRSPDGFLKMCVKPIFINPIMSSKIRLPLKMLPSWPAACLTSPRHAQTCPLVVGFSRH